MSADERIWQVRMPDGSFHVPVDAIPDNPRASWIYARSTAESVAKEFGGTVVEVTRQQQGKLLDQEIASALTTPKAATPKAPQTPKLRTRPFGHTARRSIATVILESVPLNYAARSAVDAARETANEAEYKRLLRTLQAALPAVLWIGYDAKRDRAMVQEAEPIWITADPDGENPGEWRQIDRDETARMLVEAGP